LGFLRAFSQKAHWIFGALFPKKRIGFLARFFPKSASSFWRAFSQKAHQVFGTLFQKA